jgi:hypothetical protein
MPRAPRFRSLSAFLFLAFGFAAAPTAAQDSTNAWGYGYDSLKVSLAQWRQNPHARIDSFGASVQGRGLWRISVGNDSVGERPRIVVHARTHPSEVQAFYVLREMVDFVLDTTTLAAQLRSEFVFQFVPMYNPDGVELGYARLNANRVDIESNWNSGSPQPEVAALRAQFQALMTGPRPVRVALNLHSDQVNCTRFFFYHHENGTSAAYAALQREYITGVRSYFLEGLQPWNYVVSWSDGFKTQYPESFWWSNRGTGVMALTYEDTNCPGAGDFYLTARAMVLGSADYLRAHPTSLAARRMAPEAAQATRQGGAYLFRKDGRMELRDARGRVLRVQPGDAR